MTAEKIPEWELELWSSMGNGEGEHCPFLYDCQISKDGGWCPGEDGLRMTGLLDAEQFNISDYDFIVPGSCGGAMGQVEMLANKYLKEGKIYSPPVPSELALKINDKPVEIRFLPLKAHHGATWCLKDGTVIQIKEDDPPAVQRVTLFHEIFHALSHSKASPAFRKSDAKKDHFNETLACTFASTILMPADWVKTKWAEVHDLDKMANIFDVPKPSLVLRLKRLGLI